MKKFVFIVVAFVIAALPPVFARGAGDSAGSGAVKSRELKLAHFGAENSAAQTAAKQFAENVEKRTNGALKITIYANNVLGGPPQILEQVLMGTVDMTLSGQDQLAKHVPLFDTVFPSQLPDMNIWTEYLTAPSLNGLSRKSRRRGRSCCQAGNGVSDR